MPKSQIAALADRKASAKKKEDAICSSVRKSFGFFDLDQNQNHFLVFHKSSYQNPI